MTERKFEQADNKHHYDVIQENEGYSLYIPYSEHSDVIEVIQHSIRSYDEKINNNYDVVGKIELSNNSESTKEYLIEQREYQNELYIKRKQIAEKMLVEMTKI